uniref:DUF1624 domain-containing protein n=1 Tax=Strongyloides papillosus TaxID=174720 RepID=A0A0N5BR27_STREA
MAQGFLGLSAFFVYLFYIILKLNRFIRYRLNYIDGLFILMTLHFITFPYPFLSKVVTCHSLYVTQNGTEIVGCDIDMYPWCKNVTQVNPWIYLISFSMLIDIRSRKAETQREFMQIFAGCGQLIGLLITSSIYTNYGPCYVWELKLYLSL